MREIQAPTYIIGKKTFNTCQSLSFSFWKKRMLSMPERTGMHISMHIPSHCMPGVLCIAGQVQTWNRGRWFAPLSFLPLLVSINLFCNSSIRSKAIGMHKYSRKKIFFHHIFLVLIPVAIKLFNLKIMNPPCAVQSLQFIRTSSCISRRIKERSVLCVDFLH